MAANPYIFIDTSDDGRSNLASISSVGYVSIPNIVNMSRFPSAPYISIPTLVMRDQDDRGIQVSYNSRIRNTIEPNAGAHYYIESARESTYDRISCLVNLSNISLNTGNGARNAFISFSMVTEGTTVFFCDLGLGYIATRGGWHATYNCGLVSGGFSNNVTADSYGFLDGKFLPQSGYIKLVYHVKVTGTVQRVECKFYASNASGSELGEPKALIAFEGGPGQLFKTASGRPIWTRKRFMSLVPTNPRGTGSLFGADIADGTSMTATMEDIRQYTSDSDTLGVPWSDGYAQGAEPHRAADVCYAWIVQPNNTGAAKHLMWHVGGKVKDYFIINHVNETKC